MIEARITLLAERYRLPAEVRERRVERCLVHTCERVEGDPHHAGQVIPIGEMVAADEAPVITYAP